jgi:hypothetical protein
MNGCRTVVVIRREDCAIVRLSHTFKFDQFPNAMLNILSDRFGFGCLEESAVTVIRAALNTDVIPRHLQFLENIAARSTTGWIAGTDGRIDHQYY